MTPPTVNAGYNPYENNVNFPAGILQPPFFDKSMDDAVNFGAIGAAIGHELTHGFDDQGRKFDAKGNLADWWTAADGKEFEKRASCLADEYSGFTVAGGEVHLNGRLTLGENTADNGGVRIALMALEDTLKGSPEAPRDGFTPEQRFFLGWGQIWCESITDQSAKAARPDRPPFARPLPRQRRRLEHARVPEGFQLPRQGADGARERLPRLVRPPVGRLQRSRPLQPVSIDLPAHSGPTRWSTTGRAARCPQNRSISSRTSSWSR